MLTNDDLKQLQKLFRDEIRPIVREEVQNEAEDIKSDLSMVRLRLHGEISETQDRVKNIEIRTSSIANNQDEKFDVLTKEFKIISRSLRQARKDIKTMIVLFDEADIKLRRRVDSIEKRVEKIEGN